MRFVVPHERLRPSSGESEVVTKVTKKTRSLIRRRDLSDSKIARRHFEAFERYITRQVGWLGSHSCCSLSFVLVPSLDIHLSHPSMARIHRKPKGQTVRGTNLPIILLSTNLCAKTSGVVRGFVFGPVRPCPTPVSFTSIVPQHETFEQPRYIEVEHKFAKKVVLSRIHDCAVTIGRDVFIVSAYWEGADSPNRAVEAACPGLEWRGEIAVVQAGRFVTYYKRVRNPSVVNKVVSK